MQHESFSRAFIPGTDESEGSKRVQLSVFFRRFASSMGARPLLMLVLLVLWGCLLSVILVRFALATDGLVFYGLDNVAATRIMAILIAATTLTLGWRLATVNRILRRALLREYRKVKAIGDVGAEKRIRQFTDALGIRGNFVRRQLRLLQLAPGPFLALILFLISASCAAVVLFHLFHHVRDNSWRDFVFANTPWLLAALTILYLIFNDIWVLDLLEDQILSLSAMGQADFERHLRQFKGTLTQTESVVFQKRFVEGCLVKNIFGKRAECTAKTHINHINHKWEKYRQAHGIGITLKMFVQKVTPEEGGNAV